MRTYDVISSLPAQGIVLGEGTIEAPSLRVALAEALRNERDVIIRAGNRIVRAETAGAQETRLTVQSRARRTELSGSVWTTDEWPKDLQA